MRVAIDLRMAGHTGIGRYLRSLLGEMARGGGVRLTGILNPSQDAGWLPAKVEKRVLPREIPVYSLSEQVRMGRFLDEATCDLVHVPHFNIPWRPLAKPLVVTIHDLAYLDFSDQGRTLLHTAVARRLIRRAAERSSRILTVSEFSRRRIGDLLGGQVERKTRVVYHGAEHLPAPPGEPLGGTRQAGLPPPGRDGPERDPATLLYVGNHLPHKNLPFLAEVLSILARTTPGIRLELTGGCSRHTAVALAAARRFGVEKSLVWLGPLGDAELVSAYRRATLLAHPSLYEGFGFSVLEAMRQGLPVVASDAASIPEVAGSVCLLLPPRDAEAWARGVASLLADGPRRGEMARKGTERARAFTWAEAARKTLAVYREVLESGTV